MERSCKSDGISEAFSDVELLELLANKDQEIAAKLAIIEKRCATESYDNHTAIICEVEQKDLPNGTLIPIEWISIASLYETEKLDNVSIEDTNDDEEENWSKKRNGFDFKYQKRIH